VNERVGSLSEVSIFQQRPSVMREGGHRLSDRPEALAYFRHACPFEYHSASFKLTGKNLRKQFAGSLQWSSRGRA